MPTGRSILAKHARRLREREAAPVPYRVGHRVVHTIFGKGTVTRITPTAVRITFDQHGEKELMRSFSERKITRLDEPRAQLGEKVEEVKILVMVRTTHGLYSKDVTTIAHARKYLSGVLSEIKAVESKKPTTK